MPIWSPERDPEWSDFVTVLRTGDPALLAVAKSVLSEAGIPSLSKGEGIQDLFGLGRVGTGYNVLTGPVELQVMRENEHDARRLLAALEEGAEVDVAFDVPEDGAYEDADADDGEPEALGVIRNAPWRRLIWLVPSALAIVWVLVSVFGTESPRPLTRDLPGPQGSVFEPGLVTAFYGRVWMAEGGKQGEYPNIARTRLVAHRDSIVLEEWTVDRGDTLIFYPVFAALSPDSTWLLRVGDPHEAPLSPSVIPRLWREKVVEEGAAASPSH